MRRRWSEGRQESALHLVYNRQILDPRFAQYGRMFRFTTSQLEHTDVHICMVIVVSIHISIRGRTGVLPLVKALELREFKATRFIQERRSLMTTQSLWECESKMHFGVNLTCKPCFCNLVGVPLAKILSSCPVLANMMPTLFSF